MVEPRDRPAPAAGDATGRRGKQEPVVLTSEERFDLYVLRRATAYQRWVLEQFGDAISGEVLEVGAGIGNFTRWIAESASRVVACEPDAELAKTLTKEKPPNVEIVTMRVEDLRYDQGFDSVVMFNVLEHISQEREVMRGVHALLRPGGALCLFTPAHRFLYGSLDAIYGHIRRYDRVGVVRLLRSTGFLPQRVEYFNPLGALGWLVVGRILRRSRIDPVSVAISEHLAVPIGRALARIGPPTFGQSVVAVATRLSKPKEEEP